MEIKKIAQNSLNFIIKRFIELLGIIICVMGLMLLISLLSYSPEDPNFIFPDNLEVKNLFGFRGSFISDLFFQSIGFISILFAVTLTITGINITKSKQVFILIENLFFIIMSSLAGCIFLSSFYDNSFLLSLNGSGGFIGKYLYSSILGDLINSSPRISFYFLLILTLILFFLSINFKITSSINFLKYLTNLTFKRKIDENIFEKEVSSSENNNFFKSSTDPVQENLPFYQVSAWKPDGRAA